MIKSLSYSVFLAMGAAPLAAAPVNVRVTDSSGRPVTDAVVTLRPDGGGRAMPMAGNYSVSQKDLQFHPFVAIVPVGARVSFPNLDPTKHHVYSFSPAKKFELKLFAKDQSRSVTFDKAGVVALGCNIHDQMSAYIVVTDSAWTAKTDARGIAHFADAPSASMMAVWHPYLRAPGGTVSRRLGPGERMANVAVKLRAPPMHAMEAY
jgi:plastocyanin